MADNSELAGITGEPSWPRPDDPEWADVSEQTQRWLEGTQPEALAERVSETIADAFHAMSRLAMTFSSTPSGAWENALAQLPPERAEVLREQLEFAKAYGQDQHATRGTEGNLSDNLFALTLKSQRARTTSEPIT